MNFLTPSLLLGAAFVALPVILHLIMRQQPRKLEFPALQFVRAREVANRRRFRVRNWLLLLLRCAAIALLALALARPRLRSASFLPDEAAPVAAALVFDTGSNMAYRHRNQTRLQAAQEIGAKLLEEFTSASEVWVLDSRPATAIYPLDPRSASNRVERLETAAAVDPLPQVLHQAIQALAGSDLEFKELYVFTDLAQRQWQPETAAAWKQAAAVIPGLRLYIIDVGRPDPVNTTLGDLELSDQVAVRGTPLRIAASLTQQGEAEERIVELFFETSQGEMEKRGEQIIASDVEGPTVLEFQLSGLPLGRRGGYLKLAGNDALPADNRRFFTVEVREKWQVLILSDDSASLVRTAIEARGQATCEVRKVSELTEIALEDYGQVLLLNPATLPPGGWPLLYDYVVAGGGLLVGLGPAAKLEDLNQPSARRLLPASVEQRAREPDGTVFTPKNLQYPIFADFRILESQVPWNDFPIWKYWRLGDLTRGTDVLATTSRGDPLLMERPVGRGRVLCLTTPLNEKRIDRFSWNVLLTGTGAQPPWPGFMLTNLAVMYLSGSAETRLNYFVGETAVLPQDDFPGAELVTVVTPPGEVIRLVTDVTSESLLFSNTLWPGGYQVRAGGAESRQFSVNLPAVATDLNRISKEALEALMEGLAVTLVASGSDVERSLEAGRRGQELFPYLMLLVVLALIAEQWLANRHYGSEPATTAAAPPQADWLPRIFRSFPRFPRRETA